MRRIGKRIHKGGACTPTGIFLRVGIPLVVAHAVAILVSYLQAQEQNFLLAKATHVPFLEYMIASCAIVICGALLIEIVWQSDKE